MSNRDSLSNLAWRTFMNLSPDPKEETMASAVGGHNALSATDPDNPQNWPLRRKLYASAVSFAFVFAM